VTSQGEIVFVSRNPGKAREVKFILEKFDLSVEIADLEKVEIQADNSSQIAEESARELIPRINMSFIVEDAGLYVPSLSGFPGPYSHYVLGTIGCEGILKLLEATDSRAAYFESTVAYANSGGHIETFLGRVNGNISREVRGKEGFGFDPIFIPLGSLKTFGEVSLDEKSEISHRRRSLEAFAEWYRHTALAPPQS
jgi:XTP/dITP diphosphohydrolase